MDKQRQLTGNHLVAIVVSLCAAAVFTPVAAVAASTLVHIADPSTGSISAKRRRSSSTASSNG